jgi:hypothetical protein
MSILPSLLEALRDGLKSSVALQQRLGVSQPTVSRLIRRAGDQVARIGRGPATRYAATQPVFGTVPLIPLYGVSEAGVVAEIAGLRALAHGGYLLDTGGEAPWLRGSGGRGLFTGLPYFLEDLRPSGFLGRQIARHLSRDGSFPADPRGWTEEQVGLYLLRHGVDLPGHLVMGEAMAQRVNEREPDVVGERETEYPRLAIRALGDDPPGSSAAGEQPKFAIHQRDAGPVIVKFSPAGTSEEARRWQDLLRAEHHALTVLSEQGVPVARTALFSFAGRVFLESQRFDRVGRKGRRAAFSLALVDAEFGGEGQGWMRVGTTLHREGLLGAQSLERLVRAETFGTWIGNSDMHLGNISVAPTTDGFELLPLYDMLPMAFAPVRGELPRPRLRPPLRTAGNASFWSEMGAAAGEFWQRVAADGAVSRNFRRVAEEQARRSPES